MNEISGQLEGYATLVLKKTKIIEDLESKLARLKSQKELPVFKTSDLVKTYDTGREFDIKVKDLEKENGRLQADFAQVMAELAHKNEVIASLQLDLKMQHESISGANFNPF